MVSLRSLRHWNLWRIGLVVVALSGLAACDSANDEAGRPGGSDENRNTAPRTAAITVASILENPSLYYAQTLAIPGYVKEVLSANSMVVQDSPTAEDGNEILVINQVQGQVSFTDNQPGDPIFVQGRLHAFSEIQAQIDAPNAQQRFNDRPALLATCAALRISPDDACMRRCGEYAHYACAQKGQSP